MIAPNDDRLEAARKRQRKTEQELAKHREKVVNLIAADRAAQDEGYQTLVTQVTDLKHQLHQHRLTLGRQRFGLRCRQEKVDEMQARIEESKTIESQLAQQLEGVKFEQEEARKRIAMRVRAETDG